MRKENVFDFAADCGGISDVLLDVPLWIDHDRRVCFLVGDEVGRMRQATEIVLFKLHYLDSFELVGI
jgi:hypothetical protein